jgi:hypothetical protein
MGAKGAGAGRELIFVLPRLFNGDGRQLLPRSEGGKGGALGTSEAVGPKSEPEQPRRALPREASSRYFSSNSTNSMAVVPVFFTALVCPASCQMNSPSDGAMPRSADPGTISASTPPRT